MERLVPAIIDAWHESERAFDAAAEPHPAAIAERIHLLQEPHALSFADGADREAVVRLLEEHGLGSIVPPPA